MFEIFNNLIENLIIALFVSHYLKIKKNSYKFILTSVIINTLLSTILTQYELIGPSQTLIIQFVFIISLFLFNEHFSSQDIIISLYCNVLLFMSIYFSVLVISSLNNLSPIESFMISNLYLYNVLLSKLIFVLLCYLSLKFRPIPHFVSYNKKISIMFVFEFIIILIMAFYFVQFVLTSNFQFSSNIIFLCFIFLFMSFCYILNNFLSMYNLIYEQKLVKQKEYYIEQNLNNIKEIKREIDNIDHRINYILQSIEYDLKNKKYDEAINKIKINKELIFKIEPAIVTKNELFDFMINAEIKQLLLANKNIKISAFISKKDIYNENHIWEPIINIIRLLSHTCHYFELFLLEKEYLDIKFIIPKYDESIIQLTKELKKIKDIITIEKCDEVLVINYWEKFHEMY